MAQMTLKQKGIFINAIIGILQEKVVAKNKELAAQNLHYKQEKFDAADMFFKLAFMSDSEVNKIAKLCGI